MSRPITCNMCAKVFRGAGASRVLRKVLFFFCPRCWVNRMLCEAFMKQVAR